MRPSFNLQSMVADSESAQDDNWMLSYIDVFMLMTTIFVMLLVMNRTGQQAIEPPLSQGAVEGGDARHLAELPLIGANEYQVTELDQLIQLDTIWLSDIKRSIESNNLSNLVQLQKGDEFTSLEIQSRVLFNSGATELARSGEALLEKLVPVLLQSEGIIFIEGHTDDRPMASSEFSSNWDLASARATEVLHFFVAEGLSKKRFRAVSYGDTQPIAPNDTEENRSKNRRVSLMIQGPR